MVRSVHEHGDRAAEESSQPRTAGGPGAEQVAQREPRAGADQDHPGRLQSGEVAVAAGPGDPPARVSQRTADADPGGDEHHPVGGEQLHVRPVPPAQGRAAGARHRPARGRVEGSPAPDGARLGDQRRRDGPLPGRRRDRGSATPQRQRGQRARRDGGGEPTARTLGQREHDGSSATPALRHVTTASRASAEGRASST